LHVHSNYFFQHSIIKSNSKTIFDVIENNRINNHIYIINSYRNPIERKISSFFQNITTHLPDYKNYNVNQIIDIFNQNFLYNLEEYHPQNELYDFYHNSFFNDTKFNFENGYNILEDKNITFIRIRFNEINKWDKILSKIFNREIIIYDNNLTSNKTINDLYVSFKNNYKIPDHYLDVILKNDIHFLLNNDKEEQEEYINKWNIKRISNYNKIITNNYKINKKTLFLIKINKN